jgi:hypothetical protein
MTAGLLALGICAADAATRALVVGVSGYPALAESLRLTGPKNDSRSMTEMLVRQGVAAGDITVLADGVSELPPGVVHPGSATKDAILTELDRLAQQSGPGDLVVFYFSGHGSQQPDHDGDEGGGNDEIFLPYDVGKWDGTGVERALVDDELGARVQRILDGGADFFGIIDACNSATGFRAVAADDVRSRSVDPGELGIPAIGSTERPRDLIAPADGAEPGRGRAAFFYAAQEIEEALERTPKGAPKGESYGVFTWSLLGRIGSDPSLSYRRLHQAVVADIKRNSLMATQTPELEGELLDEPFLGMDGAAHGRQWPIYGGTVQAGSLDGLGAGAVLALYADAATPDDRPLAHARVEVAGATRSTVSPTAWPCEGGAADCAAGEEGFKKARFARLVEPATQFELTLSRPFRVDPNDGHDYSAAITALEAAVADPLAAGRSSLSDRGYDVAVALVDGTFAFAPAAGALDLRGPGSSPRLSIPDDADGARERVADAVRKLARATALQRLSGAGEDAGSLGLVPELLRRRSEGTASPGSGCSGDGAAYAAPAVTTGGEIFEDCDILTVAMRNTGRKPIDVTVLLIGADFSITPVWPSDGNANRIHIGETKTADVLQMAPNPETASEERLVFVAVSGVNRSHVAFTDLSQEGLRAVPGDDAAVDAVRALLGGDPADAMRSTGSPTKLKEDMQIEVLPFVVSAGH